MLWWAIPFIAEACAHTHFLWAHKPRERTNTGKTLVLESNCTVLMASKTTKHYQELWMKNTHRGVIGTFSLFCSPLPHWKWKRCSWHQCQWHRASSTCQAWSSSARSAAAAAATPKGKEVRWTAGEQVRQLHFITLLRVPAHCLPEWTSEGEGVILRHDKLRCTAPVLSNGSLLAVWRSVWRGQINWKQRLAKAKGKWPLEHLSLKYNRALVAPPPLTRLSLTCSPLLFYACTHF